MLSHTRRLQKKLIFVSNVKFMPVNLKFINLFQDDSDDEDFRALKTQISDDGLKCVVPPNAGTRAITPPRPKAPTPPPRPPSPPGTKVDGLQVDNMKIGEAAMVFEDLPQCVLADASSMPEPQPTMYGPNDGTYLPCSETMEYANLPYFPGQKDRLQSRKKKYRTSSDTLKLQRLIQYLKSTGSEAGAKLEANAEEYLNKVVTTEAVKKPEFTIPHYTGNEDDWSSGGED